MIINPEAWEHSVATDVGIETAGGAAGDYWQTYQGYNIVNKPVQQGFDYRLGNLDVKEYICPYNHAAENVDLTAMTNCVSIIFDRNNALLTGRKRWMKLNDFSDPVNSLAGFSISCRQDSVTLYDDCVYTLTES